MPTSTLLRFRVARSVLLVGVAGSAGCSNPLARSPFDTREIAGVDRLRQIDAFGGRSLEVGRASAGDLPPDADAAERAMDEARARYAAMDRVELGLEAARAATLANNLGLAATLIDPGVAAQRVREEEARFEAAFTLAIASVANAGPVYESLAPQGVERSDWPFAADFSGVQQGIATVAMLLGRLEILALLIGIGSRFWRQGR